MTGKPTYEELEQRIKELEEINSRLENPEKKIKAGEELYRKLFDHAGFAISLANAETSWFASFSLLRQSMAISKRANSKSCVCQTNGLSASITARAGRHMSNQARLPDTRLCE